MADLHSGIKLVGTGWDRNFAVNHRQLSSIRLNDMARFIYEVESNFYTSVVKFIRDLGYKQPIFGTGYAFSPFGLKSQGIFDMVAYGSTSSGSAVFVGPEHNNIGSIYDNLHPWAGNTLAGHPMVNREWSARYPGIYRSLSIVH